MNTEPELDQNLNAEPAPPEALMSWTFRLRVRLHESARLQFQGAERDISTAVGVVTLSAYPKGGPIAKAEWLLFKGTARTEEAARAAGEAFRNQLCRTFARMKIATELGKRQSWRPGGRFFPAMFLTDRCWTTSTGS
jgi:hypothetical protein